MRQQVEIKDPGAMIGAFSQLPLTEAEIRTSQEKIKIHLDYNMAEGNVYAVFNADDIPSDAAWWVMNQFSRDTFAVKNDATDSYHLYLKNDKTPMFLDMAYYGQDDLAPWAKPGDFVISGRDSYLITNKDAAFVSGMAYDQVGAKVIAPQELLEYMDKREAAARQAPKPSGDDPSIM